MTDEVSIRVVRKIEPRVRFWTYYKSALDGLTGLPGNYKEISCPANPTHEVIMAAIAAWQAEPVEANDRQQLAILAYQEVELETLTDVERFDHEPQASRHYLSEDSPIIYLHQFGVGQAAAK